jgi:hypothetical protein
MGIEFTRVWLTGHEFGGPQDFKKKSHIPMGGQYQPTK